MNVAQWINSIGAKLPWPFWVNHIWISLSLMTVVGVVAGNAVVGAAVAGAFYIGREFQQSAAEGQPWTEAVFDALVPLLSVGIAAVLV